ncbi:putative 5'-3' exonuclease [Streptomyces afghaniensis 772]|uniref:Putative 5'-3' exonuclease n=1 Tax=Streptomyces afghaniensis 772 TaxID=1283301 RepID=S4N1E0_9ACTN|nr:putative 5'-3' exonuclease [Streptomyces afghaniensis 772]
MKSSSPRTAFTGVPSGAFTESGTPKKARKYREAVSRSISRPVTSRIMPYATDSDMPHM